MVTPAPPTTRSSSIPASSPSAGCNQTFSTIDTWGATAKDDLAENNLEATGIAFRDMSSALYSDASSATATDVRENIDTLAADAYLAGTDCINDNLAGVNTALAQLQDGIASLHAVCGA